MLHCGWQVAVCGLLLRRERAQNLSQSPLSGVSVCWVAKMSVFSLLVCDCATLCENVCVFLACSTACRCCVSANLAFDWSSRCEPLGEYYFDRFTNCRICSQFVLKISFSYFYNLKNSQHGKISLSGRQNVILMLAEWWCAKEGDVTTFLFKILNNEFSLLAMFEVYCGLLVPSHVPLDCF